jgi:hypothetical protein
MSTRNLLTLKDGGRIRLTNLPPSVSQISRKCGNLDISQPSGPPRQVTGIDLPLRDEGGKMKAAQHYCESTLAVW